jgi:hypothetical protein
MNSFPRLNPGLDNSDLIVVAEIGSIIPLFGLFHATFLLLQLDFLQGQAPLLQILFDSSLFRLSFVVRLRLFAHFHLLSEWRKKRCSPAVLMCFHGLLGCCDASKAFAPAAEWFVATRRSTTLKHLALPSTGRHVLPFPFEVRRSERLHCLLQNVKLKLEAEAEGEAEAEADVMFACFESWPFSILWKGR